MPVLTLLLLEGLECGLDRSQPFVSEHGIVSRYLPILVGEADGIAVGVDFPFALMIPGIHLGPVLRPFAALGSVVERVCVGVYGYKGELAVDHPGKHVLEFLVFIGKLDIGPDLGA